MYSINKRYTNYKYFYVINYTYNLEVLEQKNVEDPNVLIVFAVEILSVKLIVKVGAAARRGRRHAGGGRRAAGGGPELPCHRYKSRGFTRTRTPLEFIRRFYLRILLFVSLLLVPIENFYVCMPPASAIVKRRLVNALELQ